MPSPAPTRWLLTLLSFLTAVVLLAAPPSTLHFLAVGDWGRDGQFGQRAVADAMGRTAATDGARFVISLGDNFYPDGVADTESPQWVSSFEAIYTAPSLQVPWYVVLGNHDYHLSAQAQLDYTLHSPRWKLPARYYQVSRRIDADTTVDFFFLDTNPYIEGYRANPGKYRGILEQDPSAQTRWLEAALARSTARWKIVCGHHPIISSSPKHGDTRELVSTILPLLQRHGVQVYLNGHEHDLQHLQTGGINFFCSGAGSQTRPTARDARTVFSIGDTPGFAALALTRDELKVRFMDAEGKTLYETAVPATGSTAPANP